MSDFENERIKNDMLRENGTGERLELMRKWRQTYISVSEEERFEKCLASLERISYILKDDSEFCYLGHALYSIYLDLSGDFSEFLYRMPQTKHNQEVGR